jgi:hypothetical protein
VRNLFGGELHPDHIVFLDFDAGRGEGVFGGDDGDFADLALAAGNTGGPERGGDEADSHEADDGRSRV